MEKKQPILSLKSGILYGIGIFGIQSLIGYINSYQSQFYTSIMGAELTVCAVIILVAKILSSLADPIIGNIIDASHFKSGKMKPFVAMSAIPFAAITTLMFVKIPFTNDFLMYAYITLTTLLWNIAMTFTDIPSQGMLALLSPDSDEKSMAAGISNTMKSVGLCVASVVVPVICVLTKSEVIGEKEYFLTALVIDVIAFACYGVMLKSSKEVVVSPSNKMTFKQMVDELKSNKMLMLVFLVNMLGFGRNIAMGIGVQTAAVLFDKFTIHLGSLEIVLTGENLPLLLGIGSAIPSMISILVVPMINNKIGTKKTYLIFGVYGTIISTLAYLLFVFGDSIFGTTGVFRSLWAIVISQVFIGFMFGTHGYTPMIMLSDTVDYQEMKTGKRTEGTQYAILSLSVKLSNALSVATGIFVVGLSGYKGSMSFSEVTPHMQSVVMAAYWLIPGICVALSCIPVFFYKIDGKVKDEVRAFLANKEASKAAAE